MLSASSASLPVLSQPVNVELDETTDIIIPKAGAKLVILEEGQCRIRKLFFQGELELVGPLTGKLEIVADVIEGPIQVCRSPNVHLYRRIYLADQVALQKIF